MFSVQQNWETSSKHARATNVSKHFRLLSGLLDQLVYVYQMCAR